MSGILTLLSQSPHFFADRFLLRPGRYVLGRSSKCELRVNDKTISRNHAEIEAYDATMLVRDLGSSNGTYVGSTRIGKSLVRIGQGVCFGRIAFVVLETPVATSDRVDSEVATDTGDDNRISLFGTSAGEVLSAAQLRIFVLAMEGLSQVEARGAVLTSRGTTQNQDSTKQGEL